MEDYLPIITIKFMREMINMNEENSKTIRRVVGIRNGQNENTNSKSECECYLRKLGFLKLRTRWVRETEHGVEYAEIYLRNNKYVFDTFIIEYQSNANVTKRH